MSVLKDLTLPDFNIASLEHDIGNSFLDFVLSSTPKPEPAPVLEFDAGNAAVDLESRIKLIQEEANLLKLLNILGISSEDEEDLIVETPVTSYCNAQNKFEAVKALLRSIGLSANRLERETVIKLVLEELEKLEGHVIHKMKSMESSFSSREAISQRMHTLLSRYENPTDLKDKPGKNKF